MQGERRAPGVREVAVAAGVSRQTVSRVLNDHASIRPETRARVLAAMEELDFRPNRAARMLTTARSRTIGVLAASASSLFGPASSIDAVEDAAREVGYAVTVAHAASLDPSDLGAALDHLRAQAVEGVVVIAPQQRVQDAMAQFALTVPSVTLHGAGDAADEGVFVDQLLGARLATRHLLDRGHRRIAHLAGPADWSEARARRDGFLAEMAAAGAETGAGAVAAVAVDPGAVAGGAVDPGGVAGGAVDPGGVAGPATADAAVAVVSREGDWTAASGAAIGAELMADPSITAVFASNDQMALGVLHAARIAGRAVPGDLAVVGFDDIPEAAFFAPPLTTVRQEFAELGRRCVARLVALIEGGDLAFEEPVAPVLVVRESS